MKIISLILLFSTLIFATSPDELRLPKCIKYESINKVVENDWSHASKRIQKFIEHNSTQYVDSFMKLIDKPLILKTDEEYIHEQLEQHQEFLDWNLTQLPVENMLDYKKTLHKEMTYNIYSFHRYKYTIYPEIYRGMYLYVRYLEYTHQSNKTFDIYNKIANRLLDSYKLENKVSINIMILNMKIEEYIKALTISLKNNQFSQTQKQILYNILSQFLLDQKLFNKMLRSEKKELFKYLDMFYLDDNASSKTMMKNEIFFKRMLKIVEEENLKKYLNNRETMSQIVKNYKSDIEQIHHELLSLKNIKEYEAYVEKKESFHEIFDYLDVPRLFILYVLDDFGYKNISRALKYNFSSSEFIQFVRKPYIFYGKPWIFGKYKFEYEERYRKNKKFLELLKN